MYGELSGGGLFLLVRESLMTRVDGYEEPCSSVLVLYFILYKKRPSYLRTKFMHVAFTIAGAHLASQLMVY